MRTIVVPVDFITDSLNALDYAADMASATRCDLMIVHVYPYAVALTEVAVAMYTTDMLAEEAETKLAELKEKMITRTGDSVKIHTLAKQGDIIESIKECCLGLNVYAIIMGRNDASATDRFLFGANTVSAVKKLSFPVIIIPPGASFKGLHNVGIACDFRDVFETLPVTEIKNLVKELNATLHVLHVSQETGDDFNSKTIEESGWFQDLMGDLSPKYHFIKGSDPEKEIIAFADKHHLDLLIVIPRKHDLLEKIFRHSHSKQLVLHAHVPVMAIH